MPKISTRVTFNKSAAMAQIRAANDQALTALGFQALQDANRFVPVDQGGLKDSSLTNSDREAHDMKFVLRWETPYARYLWHGKVMHGTAKNRTYGPDELDFTSKLAQKEWAKHAKEVYGEEWKALYQAALKTALHSR